MPDQAKATDFGLPVVRDWEAFMATLSLLACVDYVAQLQRNNG